MPANRWAGARASLTIALFDAARPPALTTGQLEGLERLARRMTLGELRLLAQVFKAVRATAAATTTTTHHHQG